MNYDINYDEFFADVNGKIVRRDQEEKALAEWAQEHDEDVSFCDLIEEERGYWPVIQDRNGEWVPWTAELYFWHKEQAEKTQVLAC